MLNNLCQKRESIKKEVILYPVETLRNVKFTTFLSTPHLKREKNHSTKKLSKNVWNVILGGGEKLRLNLELRPFGGKSCASRKEMRL